MRKAAIGFMVGMVVWMITGWAVPEVMVVQSSRIIPNAIALHEERNLLYAGYSNGRIGVWNVATGHLERLILDRQLESPIVSLTLAHHRQYLAAAHENGDLVLWDLDADRQYGTMIKESNPPWATLFSSDDRYLYTGNADGRLRIWNVDTKFLEAVYTRHRRVINSGVFSVDGRYLATASSDHLILIWDVDEGEIIQELRGHTDWVTSLSFTEDGRYLISTSADKRVHVWSMPQGYLLRELGPFSSELWSGGWFHNQRIVLGEASGRLSVWNMETAKEFRSVEAAHQGLIRNTVYSPKTQYLYTSSNDGAVKMWSAENLNLVATFLLAGNGEWLSNMPMGQFVSSVNALNRGDFFILDQRREYLIEDFAGYLNRVERLPIGDVDGPSIIPENLVITPLDDTLVFQLEDETLVSTIIEGERMVTVDRPRVRHEIHFDVYERESSSITIVADDYFGNVTRSDFQVHFSGFRFFLKEAFEDLPENTIAIMSGIDGDRFLVDVEDSTYAIPKDLLVLSPLAPRISLFVEDIALDHDWRTEEAQLDLRIVAEDVLGIREMALTGLRYTFFDNPIRRMESFHRLDLPFGPTELTVHATNVEDQSIKREVTITRWERAAPQFRLPPIPSEVSTATFELPIWVSDNYKVDSIRVNEKIYPVDQKETTITLPLDIFPGVNEFRIQVVDPFRNTSETRVTIRGIRKMYVQQESTPLLDEIGRTKGVLFKGTEVMVDGQTANRYRVAPSPQHEGGFVSKGLLGLTPPDMFPPGLAELSATISEDRILVRGIAYDDKKVQEIWVSGIRVTQISPVGIEIIGYPVRDSQYFQLDLMIHGEELFPIEVKVIDGVGQTFTKTIQPHL